MMKKFMKCIALLLAAVMVFSMSAAAFAQTVDTGKNGDGSITIENAYEGETYTVYKIFGVTYEKVESTNEDENETTTYAVSYTTTSDVVSAMESLKDSEGNEIECPFVFTTNDDKTYYVTIGTYYDEESEEYVEYDEEYILAFLAAYIATLGEDDIYCSETYEAGDDDGGSLVFNYVEYGYYYITTTTGTLVTVDTITPDVTVEDKNTTPSDKKTVKGEQEDDESDNQSSATVGDTQTFTVTITVGAGAYNYVLHDTMSDGLEFDDGVIVTVGGTEISDNYYTLYTSGDSNDDGNEVITDGCTFEVVFDNDWLATLDEGTEIVVTYTATVTNEAVNYDELKNKEYVSFGDGSSSTGDSTTTYLYSFEIKKTNSSGKSLSGAEFVLYTTYEDGEYGGALYFTSATEDDMETYSVVDSETSDASKTITAGNVTVNGLGAGTYYLVETKAPDGYNLLEGAVVIVITEGENGSYTITVDNENQNVDEKIDVINYAGSELPSAGGMGRTILYAIGIILILGAGIVLVVKRRAKAS